MYVIQNGVIKGKICEAGDKLRGSTGKGGTELGVRKFEESNC